MPNPNAKMPGAPGLLTGTSEHTAHREARHLYHASEPPQVPLNEAQEIKLKAAGYQDEYIPQDYPKVLSLPDRDGFREVLVKSAEEEAAVTGKTAEEVKP